MRLEAMFVWIEVFFLKHDDKHFKISLRRYLEKKGWTQKSLIEFRNIYNKKRANQGRIEQLFNYLTDYNTMFCNVAFANWSRVVSDSYCSFMWIFKKSDGKVVGVDYGFIVTSESIEVKFYLKRKNLDLKDRATTLQKFLLKTVINGEWSNLKNHLDSLRC